MSNAVTHGAASTPLMVGNCCQPGWTVGVAKKTDGNTACETSRNSEKGTPLCLRNWSGSVAFWSLPLVVWCFYFFAARKQPNHCIFGSRSAVCCHHRVESLQMASPASVRDGLCGRFSAVMPSCRGEIAAEYHSWMCTVSAVVVAECSGRRSFPTTHLRLPLREPRR